MSGFTDALAERWMSSSEGCGRDPASARAGSHEQRRRHRWFTLFTVSIGLLSSSSLPKEKINPRCFNVFLFLHLRLAARRLAARRLAARLLHPEEKHRSERETWTRRFHLFHLWEQRKQLFITRGCNQSQWQVLFHICICVYLYFMTSSFITNDDECLFNLNELYIVQTFKLYFTTRRHHLILHCDVMMTSFQP